MNRTKWRSLLRNIGPYPINPYLIFLFFVSIYLSRLVPMITLQPHGIERYRATFFALAISLIPGLIFAGYANLMQRFRPWESLGLVRYIFEVMIGQLLFSLCAPVIHKFLLKKYGFNFQVVAITNIKFFLGSLVFTLLAVALMHRAEQAVRLRLIEADNLIRKLEKEREELVNLDESIRLQTSRFLHDHVQSDLMVVAMKLKSILGKSVVEVEQVLESAIRRLEKSRSVDLKDLTQMLAPNFQVGGLSSALNVQLVQYEKNMLVTKVIDDETEALDAKSLLGIYRIVEQGLLNSLMHGPAKKALVSISTDATGCSEIVISDDGPGADLDFVSSGVGTAVIDSWVSILKGKKTVDTVPGHGYRLVVNFPA